MTKFEVKTQPGNQTDEAMLDDFLRQAGPAIEEVVSTALQHGEPQADLAIALERSFKGEAKVGCTRRKALLDGIAKDRRFSEPLRRAIGLAFSAATPAEIPVVLLVEGEGFWAGGVRRVTGAVAAVS